MQNLYNQVRASRVTYTILLGGLALAALFVVLHGINKEFLGDRLFLALDRDPNLPSWTTTALFFAAGLACGLLAWLRPSGRVPLAVLAVFAMLLSLEQMVQVHGDVEKELGDLATLVIQPLMALGLVAVVFWAARDLPALSKALLWGAIIAIAVAQGSSEVNLQFDPPYAINIFFQTLEEVAELATGVFMIAAAAQPALDAIVARVLLGSFAEEETAEPELLAS
jgi:hypothetical protein